MKGPRHGSSRAFRAKVKAAGYAWVGVWVPRRWYEGLSQRAKHLAVCKSTLVAAALEVGLRRLTTSDVDRAQRAWRQVVGESAAELLRTRRLRPIMGGPGRKKIIGLERIGVA